MSTKQETRSIPPEIKLRKIDKAIALQAGISAVHGRNLFNDSLLENGSIDEKVASLVLIGTKREETVDRIHSKTLDNLRALRKKVLSEDPTLQVTEMLINGTISESEYKNALTHNEDAVKTTINEPEDFNKPFSNLTPLQTVPLQELVRSLPDDQNMRPDEPKNIHTELDDENPVIMPRSAQTAVDAALLEPTEMLPLAQDENGSENKKDRKDHSLNRDELRALGYTKKEMEFIELTSESAQDRYTLLNALWPDKDLAKQKSSLDALIANLKKKADETGFTVEPDGNLRKRAYQFVKINQDTEPTTNLDLPTDTVTVTPDVSAENQDNQPLSSEEHAPDLSLNQNDFVLPTAEEITENQGHLSDLYENLSEDARNVLKIIQESNTPLASRDIQRALGDINIVNRSKTERAIAELSNTFPGGLLRLNTGLSNERFGWYGPLDKQELLPEEPFGLLDQVIEETRNQRISVIEEYIATNQDKKLGLNQVAEAAGIDVTQNTAKNIREIAETLGVELRGFHNDLSSEDFQRLTLAYSDSLYADLSEVKTWLQDRTQEYYSIQDIIHATKRSYGAKLSKDIRDIGESLGIDMTAFHPQLSGVDVMRIASKIKRFNPVLSEAIKKAQQEHLNGNHVSDPIQLVDSEQQDIALSDKNLDINQEPADEIIDPSEPEPSKPVIELVQDQPLIKDDQENLKRFNHEIATENVLVRLEEDVVVETIDPQLKIDTVKQFLIVGALMNHAGQEVLKRETGKPLTYDDINNLTTLLEDIAEDVGEISDPTTLSLELAEQLPYIKAHRAKFEKTNEKAAALVDVVSHLISVEDPQSLWLEMIDAVNPKVVEVKKDTVVAQAEIAVNGTDSETDNLFSPKLIYAAAVLLRNNTTRGLLERAIGKRVDDKQLEDVAKVLDSKGYQYVEDLKEKPKSFSLDEYKTVLLPQVLEVLEELANNKAEYTKGTTNVGRKILGLLPALPQNEAIELTKQIREVFKI